MQQEITFQMAFEIAMKSDLRPVTKNDLDGFAGIENPATALIGGNRERYLVIIDGGTLILIDSKDECDEMHFELVRK